jgi:hypothetical protein
MSERNLILAQVIFAGALVVVTIGYTYYTARSTEEMKLSREVEVNPVIKPNLDNSSSILVDLHFDNVGKSAARDVKIEWEVGGEEHRIEKQLLRSGEGLRAGVITERGNKKHHIRGFEGVKDELESRDGDNLLRWTISYTNLVGEREVRTGEFDVIEKIDRLFNPILAIDKTDMEETVEGIEEVSDNLEEISDKLDN